MSGGRVTWQGLEDLRAELRQLPEALAHEAADIVEAHARTAMRDIEAGYPTIAGDLRQGLALEHHRSRFGAWSRIVNRARHAGAFDRGSQTVRLTKQGWSRGIAPPRPIFTRIALRERAAMWVSLRAMLEAHGLTTVVR